jgi:Rrf2 family protein
MISQRSRYALKALIKLARLGKGVPRSTRVLAAEEGIPSGFLEQIMIDLKRAGFIASRRGKEGGYFLDKDPSELTLATIMRQIDGPVAPLPCLSRTAYRRCEDCAEEASCGLRAILSETYEAALAALEKRTLGEALARADLEQSAQGKFGPDVFMGAFI